MPEYYWLDEKDRDTIGSMVKWWKSRGGVVSRYRHEEDQSDDKGLYLARVVLDSHAVGIVAPNYFNELIGRGEGETESLGTGTFATDDIISCRDCEIYKVIDDEDGVNLVSAGFTRRVCNINDDSLKAGRWLLTVQDNFGTWYAIQQSRYKPTCDVVPDAIVLEIMGFGGSMAGANGSWTIPAINLSAGWGNFYPAYTLAGPCGFTVNATIVAEGRSLYWVVIITPDAFVLTQNGEAIGGPIAFAFYYTARIDDTEYNHRNCCQSVTLLPASSDLPYQTYNQPYDVKTFPPIRITDLQPPNRLAPFIMLKPYWRPPTYPSNLPTLFGVGGTYPTGVTGRKACLPCVVNGLPTVIRVAWSNTSPVNPATADGTYLYWDGLTGWYGGFPYNSFHGDTGYVRAPLKVSLTCVGDRLIFRRNASYSQPPTGEVDVTPSQNYSGDVVSLPTTLTSHLTAFSSDPLTYLYIDDGCNPTDPVEPGTGTGTTTLPGDHQASCCPIGQTLPDALTVTFSVDPGGPQDPTYDCFVGSYRTTYVGTDEWRFIGTACGGKNLIVLVICTGGSLRVEVTCDANAAEFILASCVLPITGNNGSFFLPVCCPTTQAVSMNVTIM